MHKVMFKLPLGVEAKCRVTGLKGTITSRLQQINGSIQYGLQPASRKGSNFMPEGWMIDEANLAVEEKDAVKPQFVLFDFAPGDAAKNRVNGFEGIITVLFEYLNGCIRYRLEGLMKDGKEVYNTPWQQELARIGDGLNAKAQEPVKRARTGGPMTRMPAQKALR